MGLESTCPTLLFRNPFPTTTCPELPGPYLKQLCQTTTTLVLIQQLSISSCLTMFERSILDNSTVTHDYKAFLYYHINCQIPRSSFLAYFGHFQLMFQTLPLQHEPYRRLWQRFGCLDKWLEVAVRPSPEDCPEDRCCNDGLG